uniref:Uncharacterized protein n=1 Tax=Arundo donax TaxID=35708 RepID=A0A0A9FK73_ARUDO
MISDVAACVFLTRDTVSASDTDSGV